MTVRWGRCFNFRRCNDAKEMQTVPIPTGAPFVCPECSETLLDEYDIALKMDRFATREKSSFTLMATVSVALLVAGVAGFAAWWGRAHSVSTAE
jgi:hypothetical protein